MPVKFDFEKFASVHHGLVSRHGQKNLHESLLQDVETLANTYLECGGTYNGNSPGWTTLIAYVYHLQEMLGFPIIKHLTGYIYKKSPTED